MSFSYNPNVPNPPNNPSSDVGDMQQNSQSINNILNVDLYTFSSSNAGKHKVSTYPENVTPVAPTGLASVIYTQPGSAAPSTSRCVYQNSAGSSLLSAVKAFAFVTVGTNPGSILNGYGISSVTGSAGTYTVTLSPALPGEYVVLVSVYNPGTPNAHASFTTISSSTFTISTFVSNSAAAVSGLSILVLQA